jgi:NAD(P)-dependent dehydrogenase (short-subunit alcohol dehydrogenase family)
VNMENVCLASPRPHYLSLIMTTVERAISRVIRHYGSIDVLINNAGIIQVGPLDHMKLSDYDDAMRTHFWGPLFFVLAVLPHLRRQGGGRIVNSRPSAAGFPYPTWCRTRRASSR